MQKNCFCKYLNYLFTFINKNVHVFVIVCLIMLGQFLWFKIPTENYDLSYSENSDWKTLGGFEENTKCMNLFFGQKLIYSFISSSEVSFNINFIDNNSKDYLINEKITKFKKGQFLPVKDGKYCLIWSNKSNKKVNLNYSTQLISDLVNNRIPVNFKVSTDKKSIQIVSGSGKIISNILMGVPILNFEINKDSTLLAVSVSDLRSSLRIYDLTNLQIKKTIPVKRLPRFLTFSVDDRFLIVGDEHSYEINRIKLKNGQKEYLTLPLLPIAMFIEANSDELLVRSEEEIIKIQIEPLEIMERNSRIEFVFGDETVFADPNEFCTVHGIPHPLFTPRQIAMSPDGLKGYYFK